MEAGAGKYFDMWYLFAFLGIAFLLVSAIAIGNKSESDQRKNMKK